MHPYFNDDLIVHGLLGDISGLFTPSCSEDLEAQERT